MCNPTDNTVLIRQRKYIQSQYRSYKAVALNLEVGTPRGLQIIGLVDDMEAYLPFGLNGFYTTTDKYVS